jgi:hypothetical protein
MSYLTDCKLKQSLEPLSRHEALAGYDSFFLHSFLLSLDVDFGILFCTTYRPSAVVTMLRTITTDSQ